MKTGLKGIEKMVWRKVCRKIPETGIHKIDFITPQIIRIDAKNEKDRISNRSQQEYNQKPYFEQDAQEKQVFSGKFLFLQLLNHGP